MVTSCAIAAETGQLGARLRLLLRVVAGLDREQTGGKLPINGAGVAGGALHRAHLLVRDRG